MNFGTNDRFKVIHYEEVSSKFAGQQLNDFLQRGTEIPSNVLDLLQKANEELAKPENQPKE
jgi:hypothetical protein